MRKSAFGRAWESAFLARDLRRMTGSDNEEIRARARQHVAERMGRLRGLPQKLGQTLSMSGDPDKAETFEPLTEHGSAMSFGEVTAALSREWGKPWDFVLAELEPEGLSASLGQVHKGRLQDGREVAVKVAYPGIREAVLNDLKVLGWVGRPSQHFVAGFNFDNYRDMILNDLEEELDYHTEMANQKDYAARIANNDPLVVPACVEELVTANVLVTEWESGLPLSTAVTWPLEARERLARILVGHFLNMFFRHGIIHADPHQGNYRFRAGREGVRIVLYDYGSVARFDRETRLLLLRLIMATRKQAGDPFRILCALGFNRELLTPVRSKLPALCQVLFEPFLSPMKFDSGSWNRRERIGDILGEDRWNFRLSGPASLVFLIRGFQGMLYYLRKLNAAVSWQLLLEPLLKRYTADMMTQKLPAVEDGACRFETMARYLHIEMLEAGQKKVGLRFPASSVERLEALMGDDIAAKVRRKGIDPDEVIRQARRSGYAPAELFRLEEKEKLVRIRLA
ncbi:MAG: AarF/UbiB family protein [Acidobacteriota bacterium]|nr:AarF/UbiB family protein [Acidobacteriota bacterium]